MSSSTLYKEKSFVDDLTAQLRESDNWDVEKAEQEDAANLIVQDRHSGKKTYIEFKEAGRYGQLPIAVILSLNKQMSKLSAGDHYILVTFSVIPDLLAHKMDELGIVAIAKPSSPDVVVGKVRAAMAG